MPLAISRTKPFRHLQSRIGRSTYLFNTILVGLENVAAGAGQQGFIAVTWTKPKNAEQAKRTASQAKVYACTSAFVTAFDVFDAFLRSLCRVSWLEFSDETIGVVTKKTTKKGGSEYSVRERVEALCSDLTLDHEPVNLDALELFARWRNIAVHGGIGGGGLSQKLVEKLCASKDHFSENYANLDINLAIDNFQNRNMPVPKEATSLIALMMNFSRELDQSAIKRVASNADGIETVASKMIEEHFYSLPPGQSTRQASEICAGSKKRRRLQLKKLLAEAGLTETTKPISAMLPNRFLIDLCDLEKRELLRKFGVKKE
jgi:hypothetical protein